MIADVHGTPMGRARTHLIGIPWTRRTDSAAPWAAGASKNPLDARRQIGTIPSRTGFGRKEPRCRDVAQPGSAPSSGRGGRGFESRRPDHRLSFPQEAFSLGGELPPWQRF